MVVSGSTTGLLGADLSYSTRYIEYQDGSLMTDGIFSDDASTAFSSVYGSGAIAPCFELKNGNVQQCISGGAVMCERTLYGNTHICLSKDSLSSVTLDSESELSVPTQVRALIT